eukprot:scaffold50_cov420-Prasinococcus_capsulatus_cf.AAC.20
MCLKPHVAKPESPRGHEYVMSRPVPAQLNVFALGVQMELDAFGRHPPQDFVTVCIRQNTPAPTTTKCLVMRPRHICNIQEPLNVAQAV